MFEKFFLSFRSSPVAPRAAVIEPVEPRILMSAAYTQYRGVNAFGAYGAVGAGMSSWGVDIVRQDVPYFDQIPLNTSTVEINGTYYHGLQSVVADDANDTSNKITILCPFTWNGSQILNSTPSATSYWGNESTAGTYNYRLKQEGAAFAGTSNVWLEVWNEPYAYNGSTMPATWVSDMETMITSIRDGGFNGKIVIPGSQEDGNETPILEQGQNLTNFDPQHNLIFDLHAYSGWTGGTTQAQIAARIQTIINSGNQFLFGEYGPSNGGTGFNNVAPFIAAATQEGVTAIAWNWSDNDASTLHNTDGSLNNTSANYDWANQVMAFTQAARTTLADPTAVQQVSLTNFYNRQGIVTDGTTFSATGGLDSGGHAFSGTSLGSSLTYSSHTFALGTSGNDVVSAAGQTISVTGNYSHLQILAVGVNGSQSGTITVQYTDGTIAKFTQGFSDWTKGSTNTNETVVKSMTHRDNYDGTTPAATPDVYGYSWGLDNTKTISSITLPTNSNIEILGIDLVN